MQPHSSERTSESSNLNHRRARKLMIVLSLAVALTTVAPAYATDSSTESAPSATKAVRNTQASSSSIATNGPSDPKEVEAFADKLFSSPSLKKLPGAVFVVVKDGQVLLSKGYGYSDVSTKKPMDPDRTILRFASITKPFASLALLQLAEQGKIDLKKDITAYMGDVAIPRKVEGPLTTEHLMTHTTGFDYPEAPDDMAIKTNAEYIRKYMPTVVRKPGTVYSYDNFAFRLQGYLVERITGVPFHEYGMQHILQPLGMTNSSFVMTPDAKKNLATSYTKTGEVLPYYEVSPADGPDGSLVSTGTDMAKFMIAVLNGGTYKGQRILQPETVREMVKIRVSAHPKIPNTTYGFESLYQESYHGETVISKGGNLPGFGSWLCLLPEQNVGFLVAYNSNEDSSVDYRNTVFRSFMDHYYPDKRPAPSQTEPSQEVKNKVVGHYRNLRIGIQVVQIAEQSDKKLSLIDPFYGAHTLTQIEPWLFRTDHGKLVGFKQEDNGEISYMDNSNVTWFEKLPVPKVLYSDIDKNHPFYGYIQDIMMRSGEPEHQGQFRPSSTITRAEFVSMLMQCLRMQPSLNAVSFTDMKGHWAAKDVQTAYELGLITGASGELFRPDQPIQRQEAAMIAWRIAQAFGSPVQEAKLVGDTDVWALDGVKYAAAMHKYGPEIKANSDGTLNYESKRSMLRQEAAALISTLLAQPIPL